MSSASNIVQLLSQDKHLSSILSDVTSIKFEDNSILYLSNGKPVHYTVGHDTTEQNENEEMSELKLPPPSKKEEDFTKLYDTIFQDRDTPDDYMNPNPTPTTPLFQGFYQVPQRLGTPLSHSERLRKVVNATNICRDLSRRYSSF